MSEHVVPPRSRVARLAVLLLLAAGLAGATRAADAAAADLQRWSGYRIAATGDAAGGWIGGYRAGRTELYLTTPGRRPNRAGFDGHRLVDDAAGRAASKRDTARAAWILSKYGGYRDATQAAAVDATVYHLLVGGAWQVDRRLGARRIDQSGDPASVARFARFMLHQSRRSAGPYAARLVATGADVGGTLAVTLVVTDGHGRPAPGLPVTLGMAGAEPRDAVTGDDGRAVARFPAGARGWQEVTAEVRNVPDHRLHLWRPEKEREAAAAEGGATRTLVVRASAPVRGPQALSMSADPGQLVAGSPARVVATVTGDGSPRTATATLHGPFASAGAAGCTGPAAATVSTAVAADGSYALGPVTPSGGYYAWQVSVGGTETTIPVTSCGATTRVRARPVTAVDWSPSAPAANTSVTATATVSGLPFPAQVQVRITLFEDATCATSIDVKDLVRFGDGPVSSSFLVPAPGTYSWRADTSAGDLWAGTSSPCRPMTTS